MAEPTIWGIHAGKMGDADALFLEHSYVAVGWEKLGDLSKLTADQDAFRAAVAKAYPGKKPGAIPNNAGQLRRFVHEIKPGHIVVYPSKRDRQIHLGRVSGDYRYDPSIKAGYPNLRPVN